MTTMKTHDILQSLLIFTLLIVLTSCDNNLYYTTLDYKTMTFVEPIEKSEKCVRFISQTENKIELEVFNYGNKLKRTYTKREGCWYSKVKYELVHEPGSKTAYGGIHEIEYFIFHDHVVYKQDSFIVYVDLINDKMYVFDNLKIKNFQKAKLEDLAKNYYSVIDYYVYFDYLYQRNRGYYGNGDLKDEVVNSLSKEPLLDIFFWMDEDIYNLGSVRKPIYDKSIPD